MDEYTSSAPGNPGSAHSAAGRHGLAITAWRGLRGRCPACGKGSLFKGFLGFRDDCEVCGEDFSTADAGDGPAIFVMLITGFVIVGAALVVEMVYHPPYWLHAVIWGPLAILIPLAMLRPLNGLLYCLQHRHGASEGKLVQD